MHTTRWSGCARIVIVSAAVLGFVGGCRQVGVRNDIPPTPAAAMPAPQSDAAPLPVETIEPGIPPLPAAEARWGGHSRPKSSSTVPVGLWEGDDRETAVEAEPAEESEPFDEADLIDLPAPAGDDGLIPAPASVLDGPIADTGDDLDTSSLVAEIDIAEFLADMHIGQTERVEPLPLPLIVPRPVPRAAQRPLIENWPRDGYPWQIVVHPAPLSVVE